MSVLAKHDHLCQYKYRSVSPKENIEFYGYFREGFCVYVFLREFSVKFRISRVCAYILCLR